MAIITISRGTFSGGKALAECVAEKLGYQCISREILREAAIHYGVPVEALSRALNDKPGIFEGMTLAQTHYLTYIQAELIKAVKDENVVYHGLAGNFLLKDVPHLLRVRVIAGMEYRVLAAMERKNISRAEALNLIRRIDAERDKWVKALYHVDRHNSANYDLVINLDGMDLSAACDTICLCVARDELKATQESRKRLEDLILAAEVRARIAADVHIRDNHLEIDAHDGVVSLGGKVDFIADADMAREVALATPGVRQIDSHMKVAPMSRGLGQF